MKIPELNIGGLIVKIPLIQGAMGVGISGSRLASAVANQGGVGVIAGVGMGYREPDYDTDPLSANLRALKSEIRKARETAPTGIIGINLMVAINNYGEMAYAAAKEGVDIIISGAGLPTKLPEFVKGFNTRIAPIVSSAKAAKVLLRYWENHYQKCADMVIVEGPEAGGHLGFSAEILKDPNKPTLMDIIKEVIEVVKPFEEKFYRNIPVVAAGGIYNGSDITKYLMAGASGVQMGTRFVCTNECDINDNFKNAYLQAQKDDITIIKSPVGMPGRALNNKFIKKVTASGGQIHDCYQCLIGCDHHKAPYCISKALINSAKGNVDEGVVFMGSNAYRVNKIISVKELIDELISETEIALSKN
ncbi:MAG: NAD(P)H-dependent flavin oxidoreductase [Bacillota bacterium]|jgi:nitronate monooxygenase